MQKLSKHFQFRQNTYVQVEEGESHYIYAVYNLKDKPEGEPSYYEVFRKKSRKAETINGRSYPEREAYPSDDAFGNWAWCCTTLERVQCIRNEKGLF